MKAFADDLKFARTASVAVKVALLSGDEFMAGVHEVNEDEGFVLYAPQYHGDNTTTRKVALDVIASVTVTDIEWNAPSSDG